MDEEEVKAKKEAAAKRIKLQKNFLLMDKDELFKLGIKDKRLEVAMMLRSKPYDVLMIFLIVFYTLLIFASLMLSDIISDPDQLLEANNTIYIIELCILGIFSIEIILHLIAFCKVYFEDYWNIFDFIIIILSIAFVLLDMLTTNSILSAVLKIRGIFRLLRIFLLMRKLNTLRVKKDMSKRQLTNNGYDIRSPLERVLEILNNMRDQVDIDEIKIIRDLNYCVNIISSNKLYDVEVNYEGHSGQDSRE